MTTWIVQNLNVTLNNWSWKQLNLESHLKWKRSSRLVLLSPSGGLMERKTLEEVVCAAAAAAPCSSCAGVQVTKAHLEILCWRGRTTGPRFPPVFHISYTAHWMASPHRVTAGHIYERCIPETYHWPDIARAQRFESHPALYANSLMELRHFARSRCHGRTAAAD